MKKIFALGKYFTAGWFLIYFYIITLIVYVIVMVNIAAFSGHHNTYDIIGIKKAINYNAK